MEKVASLRIPEVVPSPTDDCERLMEAFKGIGTDGKAVIWVLGHRNATQRKQIRETYLDLYNKSLIDDLQDELSGDFGKAMVLWVYEPPERDARLANEALKSRKKNITQLQVIVEIACATSPQHLIAVRQAYCSLFDCSLEEDIILHVSQPIQKILVSLVSSYRYDGEVVDSATANTEAAKLHEAIEGKKLDDDDLVEVLSTKNMFQLRQTFQCYDENYGNSIDKASVLGHASWYALQVFVISQTSGEVPVIKPNLRDIMACRKGILESLMKVVIWCIDSPEKHFAEVARAAIVGLGTDEDSLTRVILSRAEIDLMKVRAEYLEANNETLECAVKGDTSGDYMDFLLTLLGVNF